MVAAQPEQLAQAAPQHKHEQSCCLEATGQSQAVGLDLLVPHEPPAGGSGPTDRLRYFNWDQRDTARAAMQTLVAALSEDPINSYFTGSSRRQRRFVKDEVKGYLKALPRASNFIATADSKAVALWQLLPTETPRNELWAGWTRILAVPLRKWGQLVRLELHYEEAHEAIAAAHGAYYYLSFIGTAPEARGRGLGSRLLAEITSRADREGRWCLLEATSEKSEALYTHHGFVTYEAFRVSKKAPPVFLMKRAPVPAAAAADDDTAVTAGIAAMLAADKTGVSPVFSITAVSVSSSDDGDSVSSRGSSCGGCGLAAAVAAKEAAAAAGSNGSVLPAAGPCSPLLIPAGREGVAAVIDGVLLPAAALGSSGSKKQLPVDAQVIIRSASGSSLLLKEGAAAKASRAVGAGSNGSSKQSESPVEYGVCQDEAGCDSSSRAGAGGPTAATAAARR